MAVFGAALLAAGAAALELSDMGVLLASQTGLWGGFLGACLLASRRHGSGNPFRDFGLVATRRDVLVGLAASIVGRMMLVVVVGVTAFSAADPAGEGDTFLDSAATSPLMALAVFGVVCVGAPLVEEIFFRGLLQGALLARWGAGVAVTVQAIVFGFLHLETADAAGLGTILGIGLFGAGLGLLRLRTGRLGAGIVAHFFFNLMAFLVILAIS